MIFHEKMFLEKLHRMILVVVAHNIVVWERGWWWFCEALYMFINFFRIFCRYCTVVVVGWWFRVATKSKEKNFFFCHFIVFSCILYTFCINMSPSVSDIGNVERNEGLSLLQACYTLFRFNTIVSFTRAVYNYIFVFNGKSDHINEFCLFVRLAEIQINTLLV